MIKIKIETRKVEYDLKIYGKYTILLGESGSGKTRLVRDVYTLNPSGTAISFGNRSFSLP